jgi:hypothetical protein
MKYKWTTAEQKYLHVIEDDGKSYKSIDGVDSTSTDYQEYLKWVAEGNEPLPADE